MSLCATCVYNPREKQRLVVYKYLVAAQMSFNICRNGLSKDDMLTLYQYLVQTLLPKEVEKEIHGGAVTAAQKLGRFISPPEGIQIKEDLERLAKLHLMREDDNETREYYLVVYRTLSATICFTVDGK